jgi:hypothetical protein
MRIRNQKASWEPPQGVCLLGAIFVLFVLFPKTASADVPLTGMELFPIIFPVAVILETLSIWILNGIVWKLKFGLGRIFLIVLGANALSSAVGFLMPLEL